MKKSNKKTQASETKKGGKYYNKGLESTKNDLAVKKMNGNLEKIKKEEIKKFKAEAVAEAKEKESLKVENKKLKEELLEFIKKEQLAEDNYLKKLTVDKELTDGLHSLEEYIENTKSEFKEGDWVTYSQDGFSVLLKFYQRKGDKIYSSEYYDTTGMSTVNGGYTTHVDLRLATLDEIEEILSAVAKRLGFCEPGLKFTFEENNRFADFETSDGVELWRDKKNEEAYLNLYPKDGNGVIYDYASGTWATLKEKKKEKKTQNRITNQKQ